MTTVNWVVDTDGRHEVSSPEHLVQIMHNGEKYTNAGVAPTDYLQEATKYIQTVDIDLKNYHGDIVPIGGESGLFMATYDGGGHSIANWELHDGSYRRNYSGMFGRIDGTNAAGATVKHLRLTGVWKNTGESEYKGFLAAFLNKKTCSVYDVKTDFEQGTLLSGAFNNRVGVLVGANQGHISGCVIEGFIKFSGHAYNLGGFCGALDGGGSITYCANYGNFVGGLGTYNSNLSSLVGGIAGRSHYSFKEMHHVINGMVGNLVGGTVGGIIANYMNGGPPERADTWLNCMVGDIIGTNRTGPVGGLFGDIWEGASQLVSLSKMVNYMSGSITSEVSLYPTGGIVGRVHNNWGPAIFNLSNSIVAMSGFVEDATIGKMSKGDQYPPDASVTVNTDFGLTFDTNTFATADPLTDFVTDDTFTLLPYLDMSGTTDFGTTVEFDPIFANLSGLDVSSPYAQYTTLTIHTSPVITFPAKTSFAYDEANTTKYFTYSKAGAVSLTLYVEDGITVESSAADTIFTQSGALVSGLNWTQDEFGSYEISSFKHLIQLMTKGTVFADTGSFPLDYRVGSYTQTVDINMAGYKSAIVPIGQKDDPFVGDYVGGGFSISDWSYERGIVEDGTDVRLGLFGEMQGNISQLKLRGVWSLGWSNCSQAGFLVGRVTGSTSSIFDIDADFDEGTIIQPNNATCGILIGETEGISTGIHLSGAITYEGRSAILGGVVGEISNGASISWIRNGATFNKTHAGLGGYNGVNTAMSDVAVGGIVGSIGPNTDSAFHLFNAMVGNIHGEFCGGIVGRCSAGAMTRSDTWVNCMQGNVTGSAQTTNGCSGGIIGDFRATGVQIPVITKVANYMLGDIVGTQSGGIIGRTIDASGGAAPAVQCNNSVCAMNGTVTDTAIGQAGHSVALSIIVNADFGLVFTTNSHASEDALTGYVTNPEFPLAYLDMKGGELGVTNDFEIMFVNLGGVAETSPFFGRECLTIHTSPIVKFPYKTEFDFADTNTTVYLTYGRLSSPTLYIDPSLTVLSTEALHVLDHSGSLVMGVYPPITVSVLDSESSARKQHHSFTAYTKEAAISTRTDSWAGNHTNIANSIVLRTLVDGYLNVGTAGLYSRGMHYNAATDNVYYINGSNGKFQAFGMESYTGIVDISTDGTYHTLKGDFSNTYIFGSKTSAGGVQQVFRTDADGTNEIVVDTSTLFEGNDYGTSGFAVDRDNQKVYFHDTANYIVRSLSWELTGLVNMQTLVGDLTLQDQNAGSLCYAQGFLYFGGSDPQTNEADSKFYQYDLKDGGTREMVGVSDHMRYGSLGPTNDLYIDPFQNVMSITGYSKTWAVQGADFEFYKAYCSVTTQYYDGWDVTWEAVEGATSYQVVINGLVVGTTTDLTFTTGGHADGAHLSISIKYSTDDVTYADALYRYTTATVQAKFPELVSPSNFERLSEGSATWLDPYNPSDIVYIKSGGMGIYNFSADTMTTYAASGITMLRRSFATKDIIGLANNRLINLGENAKHVVEATIPADDIYTHPQSIHHFHCSYGGLMYFTVKTSNEVWSVKVDGTDAQLLFTLNGTATSLATDPHNPTTLVYGDGNDLMYRNLSTGVSRVVFAGAKMSLNNGIVVLDDVIYTTYRWQTEGYLRVNIDGVTGLEQGARAWGFGTVVDTVNQRVYQLDIGNYTVHVDGSVPIASLPPDPSSMIVTTTPLGLLAQWGPMEGAVQYRLGTSVGSEGESGITIRHTTVDVLRYRHTAESETTHTVYLYYDTSDATNVLHSARTVQIPAASNSAEDFDKSFFESVTGGDGYDLTTVKGDFGLVMNDLFQSGDKVKMALSSGKHLETRFVKRGETVRLAKDEVLSVPFSPDAGAGQKVSFTLSDDSTVSVEYDEATEHITIDGVAYASGDTFVMDGQKVTIVDA